MTIKQQGGIFGRNPTFNDVDVDNDISISGDATVTGKLGVGATNTVLGFYAEKDNGSGYIGGFRSTNSSPYLTIQTTGGVTNLQGINSGFTDVAAIGLQPSGGNINVGAGNFVMTSGYGIDFSATSGTGTSELFDDYEEGTWTPVLTGSGSNPTGTVVAKYTKVGQVVSVEGKYTFSTAGSGNYALTFASLPFTVAAGRITGTFSLLDSGTAWYQGVCSGDGVNVGFTTVAPVTFSSTAPFTVAASDELNFNFTYVTS